MKGGAQVQSFVAGCRFSAWRGVAPDVAAGAKSGVRLSGRFQGLCSLSCVVQTSSTKIGTKYSLFFSVFIR